jgi:hypothetical protein
VGNYINITILADSVAPTRQGFGRAAVPSYSAALTADELFTSAAAVATKFGANSFEAKAADALFAQNPRPKDVLFAKCSLPPTKRYSLSVVAVRNSHKYQIVVRGNGVTETTVEYTSDASATDGEIVAGLVAALNAVVGKNFTAAGATSPFTVTANSAGAWFTLEILDRTDLSMEQTHADPGLATDLAALLNRDNTWYWLYTGQADSTAVIAAAAAWANSNGKLYIPQGSDTLDVTATSNGTNGALDDAKAAGYERAAGVWTSKEYLCRGARLIGNLAPRTPGKWTALGKRLNGDVAETLTPTERANLIARNANFVETERGVKVVTPGTTAAGPTVLRGFIDTVVFLDWQQDDAEARLFAAVVGAEKIPRTDNGMVILQGALEASFAAGVSNGGIAELTAEDNDGVASPQVTVPLVSEMDDLLPRGVRLSGSFKLAGAVHSVDVNVTVVQ